MNLDKPAKIILKECMALKSNESCLIVTDKKLWPIGTALYRSSLKISKKSKLIFTDIPRTHGAEPPSDVSKEMLKYDVILLATTKSLTHTKARENASSRGARIASMPGITTDMMQRALNVDFQKIRKLNNRLISRLIYKNKIQIITRKGTNIKFDLKDRKWLSDDGIYTKKGSMGNLPAGEIFIAPLEGRTSGTLVVDGSVASLGKAHKNITIKIKNGLIKEVNGGRTANKFKKLLKNKLYKNVAELGIGTNPKAGITGEVLEDEKVQGTFHVAFGNNKHFGGKVDVPFHVDFVIKNPTIFAGNVLIMKNGKIIH